MRTLDDLLEGNRRWATERDARDPGFFTRLAQQQTPQYLWIGCADSRVPATEICGLDPGEMFVHRNVANVVVHTDLNCLSVLQFAVEVLQVREIIVCGHYGCGGVRAATGSTANGLIDNWLRHVKDVYAAHREELDPLPSDERVNRLCELNVRAQVAQLAYTTIVQDAWRRGQELALHGLIYSLADGILRDLEVNLTSAHQLPAIYRMD